MDGTSRYGSLRSQQPSPKPREFAVYSDNPNPYRCTYRSQEPAGSADTVFRRVDWGSRRTTPQSDVSMSTDPGEGPSTVSHIGIRRNRGDIPESTDAEDEPRFISNIGMRRDHDPCLSRSVASSIDEPEPADDEVLSRRRNEDKKGKGKSEENAVDVEQRELRHTKSVADTRSRGYFRRPHFPSNASFQSLQREVRRLKSEVCFLKHRAGQGSASGGRPNSSLYARLTRSRDSLGATPTVLSDTNSLAHIGDSSISLRVPRNRNRNGRELQRPLSSGTEPSETPTGHLERIERQVFFVPDRDERDPPPTPASRWSPESQSDRERRTVLQRAGRRLKRLFRRTTKDKEDSSSSRGSDGSKPYWVDGASKKTPKKDGTMAQPLSAALQSMAYTDTHAPSRVSSDDGSTKTKKRRTLSRPSSWFK